MDRRKLREEIATDPLGRGYDTMSDSEVAADLRTVYRTRDVQSFTGDKCFQSTDSQEFGGLTDHKQILWLSFCGRDTIDPWAPQNVTFVQWVFGSGSVTESNLAGLRTEQCTRAEELGLGRVTEGDVSRARSAT